MLRGNFMSRRELSLLRYFDGGVLVIVGLCGCAD
jgi:hypothetical protein